MSDSFDKAKCALVHSSMQGFREDATSTVKHAGTQGLQAHCHSLMSNPQMISNYQLNADDWLLRGIRSYTVGWL